MSDMHNTTGTTEHTRAAEHVVTITPEAATEIKRLIQLEHEQPLHLRIGVAAGGCSGMSYSMAFDTSIKDNDLQFDHDGITVLIDTAAAPYLAGCILEYKGGLLGGGFNFSNPNARRSCGCGSSFTC
jgi:iron-sulfur cluster assembly accessory protein